MANLGVVLYTKYEIDPNKYSGNHNLRCTTAFATELY
jgi:hypothetical protein